MKINKKLLLGIGTIATVTTPFVTLACDNGPDRGAHQEEDLSRGFIWEPGKTKITSREFKKAILPDDFQIPEGITEIEAYAFQGVTLPENFKLPASLAIIGIGVFVEATFQSQFIWPSRLKTIPRDTFNEATFAKIVDKDGEIDNSTTSGNDNNVSFKVEDKVTTIGESAFEEAKFFGRTIFGEDVSYYSDKAFVGADFTEIDPNFQFGNNNGKKVQFGIDDDPIFEKSEWSIEKIIPGKNGNKDKKYDDWSHWGISYNVKTRRYFVTNDPKKTSIHADPFNSSHKLNWKIWPSGAQNYLGKPFPDYKTKWEFKED